MKSTTVSRMVGTYMFNNQLGEPGAANYDIYKEHGDIDEEDDDDEPNYLSMKPRCTNSRGGVDRTISGCSFMSTDTLSSNLSIFSNLSMLSSNLLLAGSSGERECKMNMARSVHSNLSLMSDVTDVLHTFDAVKHFLTKNNRGQLFQLV